MITLLNCTDDSVFKNKSFQESINEEKDAGVKEKELVEDKEIDSGSHDGSEDEKKSAVEDKDFIVQLLATNPLAMQVGLRLTVVNCCMCVITCSLQFIFTLVNYIAIALFICELILRRLLE